MDLVIGTSEGLYRARAGERAEAAAALAGLFVRHVSRIGTDLVAGTSAGLFRSSDDGRTWRHDGFDGHTVWDVAVAPDDPATLFATTQPASVFQSRDGGRSWRDVASFRDVPGADTWWVPFTPPEPACARSIAVDRADPARWFVAVEVGGVVRTEDAGERWTVELPGCVPDVPVNPDIHTVAIHPGTGALLATTGYGRIDLTEPRDKRSAGVFASDDGGKSWRYLWAGVQPRYVRPMVIDPRAPYAITVGASPLTSSSSRDPGGAQAMLYRSADAGETWRSLGDEAHSPGRGNFLALTVDPEVPGGVLVGTDPGEVWRVSPSAEWTLLVSGLPEVHAIAVR